MKEDFYGLKGDMQKINSRETPPEQEMMMVTSMDELDITNLITGSQWKTEEIDLKAVNSYMDMFLMESTEAKIEELLLSTAGIQ